MKVSAAILALLTTDAASRVVPSWNACTSDDQCLIKGDMCCVAYEFNVNSVTLCGRW